MPTKEQMKALVDVYTVRVKHNEWYSDYVLLQEIVEFLYYNPFELTKVRDNFRFLDRMVKTKLFCKAPCPATFYVSVKLAPRR